MSACTIILALSALANASTVVIAALCHRHARAVRRSVERGVPQ